MGCNEFIYIITVSVGSEGSALLDFEETQDENDDEYDNNEDDEDEEDLLISNYDSRSRDSWLTRFKKRLKQNIFG